MINVLIKDDNHFYAQSLLQFVTELFRYEFQQQVNILPVYNEESLSQAQITIISLCEGEHFTCFSELYNLGESIVIGVVDRAFRNAARLPHCIKYIMLVERATSLKTLEQRIISLWRQHEFPVGICRLSCASCMHKTLSSQQLNIMTKLYAGKKSQQIASELSLSEKTIFAHKYGVMSKFCLRNDYDLVRLLKCMEQKNITPNAFRERLKNESTAVRCNEDSDTGLHITTPVL